MSFPLIPPPQQKVLAAPPQQKAPAASNNIPLPSTYVSRTESEVQLAMDVAAAERRDERMFHRLINGIQDRHRQIKKKTGLSTPTRSNPRTRYSDRDSINVTDSNECLDPATAIANIVGTHHSTDWDSNTQLIDDHDNNDVHSRSTTQPKMVPNRANKNLSDSTLSDNDWSITGYDVSVSNNIELNEMEQEDDDEEIFVLDL